MIIILCFQLAIMKREKRKKSESKSSQKITTKIPQKQEKKTQKFNLELFFNGWSLALLILLIGIIAFGKYLSTEYLFFFKDIGSDSINQNFPANVHQANLWKDAFFTKWSFYRGMGDKNIYTIPVEPYGMIRTGLNKIGTDLFGAEYLVYGRFLSNFLFNFLLTGLVFYFYLRTLSINKFSGIIGAIIVTFSGYVIVGSGWGFASQVFKVVFLLFAFEQLYVKKRWFYFPFAIIFLSGNVFVLYIYSFFLLVYSLFRYVFDKENKAIDYLKLLGKMVFLGLIGLLMNIQSFWISFQKLFNSPRVAGNASYSQYLTEGIDITNQANLGATTILRTFSSDILGTGSNFKGWNNYLEAPLFYIGLLTLLVLPQVFIYLNKRKRIVFGAFLGFWMLTLVFPYLRYTILAYTGDYFRYGFDFFIPFTFLFYAVYALNKIDEGFKINYKLLGATLFFLLFLLFFPYQSIKISAIDNQIRIVLVVFLLAYSGLLISFSIPKYKSYAQIGLILLVCIELSYSSYKSYEKRVPVTKKEFKKNKAGYADGSIKAIEYIEANDKTLFYRTEKDYNSGSAEHTSLNDALAQGYYGTASYSSFNQLNYIRFLEETEVIKKGNEIQTRWAPGFRGYPLLQTFGSVKYHLSKSAEPGFKRSGFDSIASVDSVQILKNRFYLPFGFTYDKYVKFANFQNLSFFHKQLALLNGFVYEEDEFPEIETGNYTALAFADSSVFAAENRFNFQLYQQFTDSLKKDTLAITLFKQDNIIGSISLSKPKVLFFTIPFDEGWKIKVNGIEQKLSRVNIGFTGLDLPAGEHKIELYYVPKYYVLTSLVSWVSVVLFWLYLGYYLIRKRREKKLKSG